MQAVDVDRHLFARRKWVGRFENDRFLVVCENGLTQVSATYRTLDGELQAIKILIAQNRSVSNRNRRSFGNIFGVLQGRVILGRM